MSLSRILNDDPLPVRPPYVPSSPPRPEHRAPHPLSPSLPPRSPPRTQSSAYHPRYDSPPPRDSAFRSTSADWLDNIPLGSNTYGRVLASDVSHSPRYFDIDVSSSATVRKRRRAPEQDIDYPSAVSRRVSSTLMTKQPSPTSPPVLDVSDPRHSGQPISEEKRRLVSSDLEDCEEVWLGELSDYILETKKRQNQVAKWFEASILERNSLAAQDISHQYASRIASISLPPSPPARNIYSTRPVDNIESSVSHSRLHGGQGQSPQEHLRISEDSVPGLKMDEIDVPIAMYKVKQKATVKRPASGVVSDASSDLEVSRRHGHNGSVSHKRRKIDREAESVADDLERSVIDEPSLPSITLKIPPNLGKGKVKAKQPQREPSHDSVSATPKPRKKPGPKKKLGLAPEIENEVAAATASSSRPPSIAGDATPTVSRPTSPAPTNASLVYELDEQVPPLKKAKKIDDNAMVKRIKSLEEAQKKVWTNLARRDVAKVYKYHALGYQTRQSLSERMAKLASIQARKPFTKTTKAQKDTQAKAKRLMREMQVFWKKNEKEERDVRKREQKEAMDRLKIEEEKREAARQARKLEFLISQTELYSHFVGSKLKTNELEGEGENVPAPAGANVVDVDPSSLPEIDFDDTDYTNLHRHARYNAQEAIALARQRAQQFDTQAALERKTNEALKLAKAQAHIRDTAEENNDISGVPLVDLDSDELNFQNPTSLSGSLTIGQPKMLMAQLKEYQLKGLNWLATLYEQGINGILADEMGLGKTVQSISLLAYLAEAHDIWGPFLVVAPASTLHNWQQEITRFVPRLKALPYWGNVKDRATLRKFWSKKEISYNQDAPFHVLITSYQLVTQDQQYFQRVKWQYMILDEAQNIKNSSSVRWKTLLGFQCRNRLLLTGTPIQNSMQELWALLHFIMPSLFDSHDEFNEWFSKDIENAAENKGSKLNEHQLRRLHMILKPFMLRRVKRHVQNELSEKIERDIYVDMSARQRALYQALLANVSVADLLEKAANIGDVESARSLMNLVMQFRKVCNHPELFERADVVAPFSFSKFGRSGSLMREGDFIILPYSTRNPIELHVPKLFYQDGGLIDITCINYSVKSESFRMPKIFDIWSVDWIHRSLNESTSFSFSFLKLLDISTADAHSLHVSPLIRRKLRILEQETQTEEMAPYSCDSTFTAFYSRSPFKLDLSPSLLHLHGDISLPLLDAISLYSWNQSCLSRPALKWFIPAAVAPPISMYSFDRSFMEHQERLSDAPTESLALYGVLPHLRNSIEACRAFHSLIPFISPLGLFPSSPTSQIPISPMQVPEAKRLIYDSAKLARLDSLLQELKAGDHRVLVYFQMTRMMDLMEEYLIFRQYKYLRLDGSSKLEDRRDMVIDWQTRCTGYLCFLLSTRAGGLGINLTAADTVIFYDHDWNPSNDAQAMDRAHRLGQTRQVTVYRLITKGTIDERIVQLARVKKDVQDIVVGNKNFTDVTKPSEIVQLLLNDEQLASLDSNSSGIHGKVAEKQSDGSQSELPVRDLWNDEGDDFFGHSAPATTSTNDAGEELDISLPTSTHPARGKKRRGGTTSGTRGRKTGGRKRIEATPSEIM
ncbi:SNF2 family N-terminal domain-containing protein [Cyathus striatus]|nr:SNF2 family N-terminal domain-containing protein [Cyathus striatus]